MSELTFEGELRRGDKNNRVKLVQEWLCLDLVSAKIKVDGDFGPATEAAVKQFQAAKNLAITGIVDKTTFVALVAPMQAALAAIPTDGKTINDMVVAYARQHLQQHPREVGGPNQGPWVRLYMDGREGPEWAWCAGFVSFIWRQACRALGAQVPIALSFGCDELADSAKAHHRFLSEQDAKANPARVTPGSLFLIRRTAADYTHTGLVIQANQEDVRTIEGNTNDEGSREGYEVCARIRSYLNMDFATL